MHRRRRRRSSVRPGFALAGAALLLVSSIFYAASLWKPVPQDKSEDGNALMLLPGDPPRSSVPPDEREQSAYNPVLNVYDAKQKKIVGQTLEDYVTCVVAGEVPSGFSDEAIKAQAVAARTLAVFKMKALGGRGCSKHPGADICTDSGHCQAYQDEAGRKARWGGAYAATESRYEALVAATAGDIIAYQGEPIEVFYHSTSGGVTEDIQNVFAVSRPYLVSVASRGEERAPRYEGEVQVARKEFVSKINAAFPKAKLKADTLESAVRISERNASGRVSEIKLGSASATGIEMRKLFGLNSANFTISFTAKSIVFHTLGFGHGVGMSQTGADAMAREGSDYREILLHYYTGTEILRLES